MRWLGRSRRAAATLGLVAAQRVLASSDTTGSHSTLDDAVREHRVVNMSHVSASSAPWKTSSSSSSTAGRATERRGGGRLPCLRGAGADVHSARCSAAPRSAAPYRTTRRYTGPDVRGHIFRTIPVH
ncbi:hypothetical protein CRUP_013449 [Coryphaenoides rupestris]|nr:hypothetical protein CRUP_013449 [Coryphaenoides rupestris]